MLSFNGIIIGSGVSNGFLFVWHASSNKCQIHWDFIDQHIIHATLHWLTIFLFFGVLRATVWWPMMLHLINPNWISERGMFWGVVLAFLIGFPMFVYGRMLGGGAEWTMTGTLISIFGSGVIAAVISYVDTNKSKELSWHNAS